MWHMPGRGESAYSDVLAGGSGDNVDVGGDSEGSKSLGLDTVGAELAEEGLGILKLVVVGLGSTTAEATGGDGGGVESQDGSGGESLDEHVEGWGW